MQTEDQIVRYDGPAKLDNETKSEWLLNVFHFRNEITWYHLRFILSGRIYIYIYDVVIATMKALMGFLVTNMNLLFSKLLNFDDVPFLSWGLKVRYGPAFRIPYCSTPLCLVHKVMSANN